MNPMQIELTNDIQLDSLTKEIKGISTSINEKQLPSPNVSVVNMCPCENNNDEDSISIKKR